MPKIYEYYLVDGTNGRQYNKAASEKDALAIYYRHHAVFGEDAKAKCAVLSSTDEEPDQYFSLQVQGRSRQKVVVEHRKKAPRQPSGPPEDVEFPTRQGEFRTGPTWSERDTEPPDAPGTI